MIHALLALLVCIHVTLIPGHVKRVVDGDTAIFYSPMSLGGEVRFRLLGVDAPELRDSLGPEAGDYTREWLSRGPFDFDACKNDSFGRMLAWVYRGSDTLAVDLIHDHLGKPM